MAFLFHPPPPKEFWSEPNDLDQAERHPITPIKSNSFKFRTWVHQPHSSAYPIYRPLLDSMMISIKRLGKRRCVESGGIRDHIQAECNRGVGRSARRSAPSSAAAAVAVAVASAVAGSFTLHTPATSISIS